MVDAHAVAAIEGARGDRVEEAEGRHHGARRQHLDAQLAAGHVIDLLGEIVRVFVKDVLRRPGALPAHVDRALRLDHARRRDRGARHGGSAQELAARGYVARVLGLRHSFPPKKYCAGPFARVQDPCR
jgi:hypothetical protein